MAEAAASAERGPGTWPARLARWSPVLLCAYGLGLLVLSQASVNSGTVALALSLVSWLVFTGLILVTVAGLVSLRLPRWAVVALLVVATGAWFALTYRLGPKPPVWAGVLATLCMLVAMSCLGRMLGWLFREPSLLPPALIVAGVVDLWGVQHGVVAHVAAKSMETIAKASAAVPAVAAKVPSKYALADLGIGPGDIAVAALVLGVAVSHGFDLRRNLGWMYGLTLVGLALVTLTNWLVPGLVFIGLAGLIANRDRFVYSRDEKRALALALAFVVGLLVVASVALRGTPPN